MTIRVTNLVQDAEKEDLEYLFCNIGKGVKLRRLKYQENKGVAFVTYWNKQDAELAVKELDGAPFENLIINVELLPPMD